MRIRLTLSNIVIRKSICTETCLCAKCQQEAIEQDLALMQRLILLAESGHANLNNIQSLSEQKYTTPRNNWAIRSFNKIYFDDSSSDEEPEKQKEDNGLYNKDMNTEDTMSASSQLNDKYSSSVLHLNTTWGKHKFIKTGEENEARSELIVRISTGTDEIFSNSESCLEDGEQECFKPFSILLPQSENKTQHKVAKFPGANKAISRPNKRVFKASRKEAASH